MVEAAVDKFVKKSYSEATATASSTTPTTSVPHLTMRVMRKVVQDAAEADQREKDVVILTFGLTENSEEDVNNIVSGRCRRKAAV